MQFSSSVNLAEILNRGFKNFKSTLKPFFKYAVFTVLISYLIQIYVTFMDTFLFNHEKAYIMGIVLLVLLFLPIAYYTIRLNMTAAGKLKTIIEGQPFHFKKQFKNSKYEFWRVFFVLASKFFLKVVVIVCSLPIMVEVINRLTPLGSGFVGVFSLYITIPLMIAALLALYMLTRIEFASLVIFWNIDTEFSDIETSMKMTKKHYLKKLMIMFVAHIPTLFVNVLVFSNFFTSFLNANIGIKWLYVVMMILFNAVTLSWPMTFYHALFRQMKVFSLSEDVLIDSEGREWLTF